MADSPSEIRNLADLADFMNERCEGCGCFLNNAPDCVGGCAHVDGCPPDCWDRGHPNAAMRGRLQESGDGQ